MNSYEKEIDRQADLEYNQNFSRLMGPFLLACAAGLLGTIPVVKAYYSLQWIPPWTQIWLRYLLATCTLGISCRFIQSPLKKLHIAESLQNQAEIKDYPRTNQFILLFNIAFSGFFLTSGGFVLGTKLTNEPTATLITSSFPTIFMFVLGFAVFREKLRLRKLTSFLLTMLGVIVIVLKDGQLVPFVSATTWYDDSWLVVSALFWAYQAVLVKKACRILSPLYITFMTCAIATVLFTPLMLIELWKQEKLFSIWGLIFNDLHNDLSFLYLGIFASAAAFYMWNRGIELTELSKGSVLYQFFLLSGQVLQWFILAKPFAISFYYGAVIILLGMYLMISETETDTLDSKG